MCFASAPGDPVLNPGLPQTVAEIQGNVYAVDASTGSLSVRDPSGQTVTVRITKETRLLDNEGHQLNWTTLQPNDHVHLYYNTREHRAIQIDRTPNLPEAILAPGKS